MSIPLKYISFLYEPLLGHLLKDLRLQVCNIIKNCLVQSQLNPKDQASFTVFDCCSGAGGHKKNYGSLVGLDYSIEMIRQSKKHAPNAFLLYGNATNLPIKSASFDIGIICMALHSMNYNTAMQVFKELCRVSKKVIIADYCITERNIYLPATSIAHTLEFLIGGEHYKSYQEFMKNGALEGFLQNLNIQPSSRHITLGGAGCVVLLDNY